MGVLATTKTPVEDYLRSEEKKTILLIEFDSSFKQWILVLRKEVLEQLGEEIYNPSVIANKAIEQDD